MRVHKWSLEVRRRTATTVPSKALGRAPNQIITYNSSPLASHYIICGVDKPLYMLCVATFYNFNNPICSSKNSVIHCSGIAIKWNVQLYGLTYHPFQ